MSGRVEIGWATPAAPEYGDVWGVPGDASAWAHDVETVRWRVWTGTYWSTASGVPELQQALYSARQRIRRAAVDLWLAERFR